jgi:outer membrane protein OmpA-like peptidoglycan-associated protein
MFSSKGILMRSALLATVFAFAMPALVAQAPMKDFTYLNCLPSYEMSEGDSVDQEFNAYKFFNGKKWQSVEGRFWKRAYSLKSEAKAASPLQIFRNYANAIKAAGGTVHFQGEPPDGGDYYSCYAILSGKLAKGDQEVWVLINPCNDGNDYNLFAVEVQSMRQDVVAKDLLDAIQAQGYVALDVQFDTSKTTIQPKSLPLLDQVVAMLKASAALQLSVEGHTDNKGIDAENQKLSEGRAKAVMAHLVSKGIPAARLSSVGFGASKPVADNRTEEGRAKNRRVELVKK